MKARIDRDTVALVVLGIFSAAPSVMVPILVGGLIEKLQFSRIQAGSVTSAEFMGSLAGSILVLILVGKVSRRTLALCGIPLWITCNLLSAIYANYDALLMLRAVSGLGMGVSLAVTMGAIASRPNPVRLFAGLMVGVPLFLLAAIPALQMVIGRWSVQGAYLFLAGMAALGLLLATRLPARLPQPHVEGPDATANPASNHVQIVVYLLAVALFFVGFNGAWAYVSQVGRSIGISADRIALIIGVGQIASIGGSFLAGVLNERLGYAIPLTVAIALGMGGSALLSISGGETLFAVSLVPLLFGWLMAQPFIMGVSARLDGQGKVATATNVAQNMGMAGGPFLAALAVEGRPVAMIGYFSLILFGIGLLLALPSAIRANRLGNS